LAYLDIRRGRKGGVYEEMERVLGWETMKKKGKKKFTLKKIIV